MRDYEKKLAEKEKKVKNMASETREVTGTNTDRCSSSAMDQGSEASAASDVPVSLNFSRYFSSVTFKCFYVLVVLPNSSPFLARLNKVHGELLYYPRCRR